MTEGQRQQGAGLGLVRVYPDAGSARRVQNWMNRSCGIRRGLPLREMYATILNDERNPDIAYESRRGALYDVNSVTPQIVDGNLVLALDAPELLARHQYLARIFHQFS